jgi:hypothetical protein
MRWAEVRRESVVVRMVMEVFILGEVRGCLEVFFV